MKALSCDSSSIIALSENCLLWLLDKFDAEFWIPPYVKKEIMDNPITTKKYGFEAMRNGLIIGNVIKVVETNERLRDKIINVGNRLLRAEGRFLRIIHCGEADALALAIEKGLKGILVDEKNTRLMIENPEALRRIVEKRIGKRVEINWEAVREIQRMTKGLRIIRSAEIVTIAVKRGILNWPYSKKELLKNALYALKFSGCAITEKEIIELVNSL